MIKNTMISGLEYYRRKKQKSINSVCGAAGVRPEDIRRWGNPDKILGANNLRALYKIATELGITIDQMLEIHHRAELEDGDRARRESKYNNKANCISNYRVAKNLSYDCLAVRLGCSRQNAMQLCASQHPRRATIAKLAAYERVTPETILDMYSNPAA